MKSNNSFGVHFIVRQFPTGNCYIYARIAVNKSISELAVKVPISKADWNGAKGAAKPRNEKLRQINNYLEEVRGKLFRHYQQLRLGDDVITAEAVKNAFLGADKAQEQYTLLWLVAQHNTMMREVLEYGTMKNYYTTERYLKAFMENRYTSGDILLKHLTYEFITAFEFFIRKHSLKRHDPCSNNGTMKHLERLKKIVAWGTQNEWLEKNPFTAFKLKLKHKEREYLSQEELQEIEEREFDTPALHLVRDLFVFSCYTGLAYGDLMVLKPGNVTTGPDGLKWLNISRIKTGTSAIVPLLKPALILLDKHKDQQYPGKNGTVFPYVSNQEVNRCLKLIAEACSIKKHLTFHLARHTFATTVTLLNGVPIESISKMLGHTKLTTTMIYAKVTQGKIGMDMALLQNRLDEKRSEGDLRQ